MKPRWAGVNQKLVDQAMAREHGPGKVFVEDVKPGDRLAPGTTVFASREDKKPNKYHAERTECLQRHMHDSKKEALRCNDLHLLEKAGAIRELTLTPAWDLVVEGMSVGRYVADWGYMEKGESITEDCKGVRTPAYKLKKKLMKAIYGIEIRET